MKKLIIGIFFICTGITYFLTSHANKGVSEDSNLLSLQNIEALAAGENWEDYVCYGTGTVDCPNGLKVEIYIGNLSLD